jgi:hypothetical protein
MSTLIQVLGTALMLSLTAAAAAQEAPPSGPSWDLSHGDLRVSDNKRFLVHADGTPFFYLSDTNWDFFRRARREDAERLLEKRRQQGFTVIAGAVTGILDAIYYKKPFAAPNAYGHVPFVDQDITRPLTTPGTDPNDPEQYDYWDHVDYLIGLAEAKGIYVGLIPAWIDHYRAGLVNAGNARAYGRFLGRRYGARRNIIWIMGGDTNIDVERGALQDAAAAVKQGVRALVKGSSNYSVDATTFQELAAGIKETEAYPHLMTFHPRGGSSSSNWFQNDEWLDFNMLQSGHDDYDIPNYRLIAADYKKLPIKPTMDAESRYEDHAVGHDPKRGWFTDYDNRQAAYWGLFAGGHGHAYGNRGVWQMYEPDREPSQPLRYYWYDAMNLPGAWNMLHVRNLMLSRPVLSRIPDQSLVEDTFAGADHIQATRGDGYAFIYAATGRTFRVRMGKISGAVVTASWFDPRSGGVIPIGEFTNSGVQEFDPPGDPQRGNDWVLILDDKSKGFAAPSIDSSAPKRD